MKKFYNKLNNKQWRMTVPNINNTILKKGSKSPEVNATRKSGFYDVQAAEKEYEKSRSVPNSVYIVESSSEEEEPKFEDALASEDKEQKELQDGENDNGQLYMDLEIVKKEPSFRSSAEYDVPRISFKFFEKEGVEDHDNTYENVKDQQLDSIPAQEPKYEIVNVKPVTLKPRLRSEMKIVLTAVEIDISEENPPENVENFPCEQIAVEPSTVFKVEQSKSRSVSQEFVSLTSLELSNHENKSTPVLRKCGSVPSIAIQRDVTEEDDEEEESFYKVPRSLNQKRYSQSLKDFNIESNECDSIPLNHSSHTSIEHISCSQVIFPSNQSSCISEPTTKANYSDDVDYTRERYRFPRLTLLRKPHSRWYNLKKKFNNILIEQAAHQRVGAFEDKSKIAINVEEVYKNSKSKCKNMIKATEKIFNRKKLSRNNSAEKDDSKNSTSPTRNELKASDIEYKLNICDHSDSLKSDKECEGSVPGSVNGDSDFGTIRAAFGKIKTPPLVEGQNGFDDLRRYVKQGSDFCKELATILQDRAEAEATYAKSLSKLSSKLARACREGVGTLNEGWKSVAQELEARAESHRLLGVALSEESAKPLKAITENQQKSRKQAENAVDKAAKSLSEWRTAEAKSKKHSHACARENEKLQDAALLDNSRLSRSTSLIQLGNMQKNTTDKENAKMEVKKRKAEDAVKKADIEYYTLCVRAERARLEWESAVLRGVDTFQSLEEERLNHLKSALTSYLHHSNDHYPRLIEATERLRIPAAQSESTKDLTTFINLRQTSQQVSEQLLPDFYCEHITLAMNRERRKQALIKLLHLVRQDIERERKSKNGLENLSKAIKQTPNFGAEDSQQSVSEKLYHMKSMLTYLEAARYKVQNALAELDSRPRCGHPLAPHITITRDKSGLQQSVLKAPQWLREEWVTCEKSPVSEKSVNSDKSDLHVNDIEDPHDWTDRGAADGNSNQPDSDFDEFSSQCSSTGDVKYTTEENIVQPIAQCKAIYPYTPNLNDELALKPGDLLSVYRQQDDGWWLGECNGSVGIFPATYVEIINT